MGDLPVPRILKRAEDLEELSQLCWQLRGKPMRCNYDRLSEVRENQIGGVYWIMEWVDELAEGPIEAANGLFTAIIKVTDNERTAKIRCTGTREVLDEMVKEIEEFRPNPLSYTKFAIVGHLLYYEESPKGRHKPPVPVFEAIAYTTHHLVQKMGGYAPLDRA